ncbi:hypothetical protein B566_EDAN016385 [Ephemera danica]|nr:hypothetical protein B566_EDAN016385 [Ephemera danica]
MRASQIFVVVALVAAASAFPGGHYGGGDFGGHGHKEIIDYYAYPKYQFDYAVHDPHTGDHKTQWETRDGDVVKGEYTVHDPDGTIRTVKYTSDKHNGFNAVVHRAGKSYHPQTYHHGSGHY